MKTLKRFLLCACWLLLATTSFALQVGDKAPDFTAASTHGDLSLAETLQTGPVVLAFYYADFTPV